MLSKLSSVKKIIRWLALKLFTYAENNNICNFNKNGEKMFIINVINLLISKKEKIIIFDIGANTGKYTELLIKQLHNKKMYNYEIHLFEPTKKCFKILTEKFSNNSKIILNNFGLSDKKEISKIFYDNEGSGLASLYKRNLKHYSIEFNQSEDINLDLGYNYITLNKIKHINFIKIDIEGHELVAFNGFKEYLNNEFIDFIQFEYGGANLDSHSTLMDIYKLLQEDFKIAKILPSGLEIRDYKPFMDNFNYSNYVAISKKIVKYIK